MPNLTQFHTNIPKSLLKEFGLLCRIKGVPMRQATTEAIQDWIKRNRATIPAVDFSSVVARAKKEPKAREAAPPAQPDLAMTLLREAMAKLEERKK